MRKRFMALALVVSACGDDALETTQEAGSLLRERGVLRYTVIDQNGLLTVTLCGERGAMGTMEAQLDGDRPIAVQLSLDGAETTFEADGDALWVAVDGSPRER